LFIKRFFLAKEIWLEDEKIIEAASSTALDIFGNGKTKWKLSMKEKKLHFKYPSYQN